MTMREIAFGLVYTALVAPHLPGSVVVIVCALTPLIERSMPWKIWGRTPVRASVDGYEWVTSRWRDSKNDRDLAVTALCITCGN